MKNNYSKINELNFYLITKLNTFIQHKAISWLKIANKAIYFKQIYSLFKKIFY